MKLGLMQPYFFPYIGYYQLIHAVDTFIIYDTVNYIKTSWIKRNRYLLNGSSKFFTLSIKNASSNKLIIDTYIADEDLLHSKDKIAKTIRMAYSKAPYFDEVFPFLNSLIQYEEDNISNYNTHILLETCNYLNIDTEILQGSKVLTHSTSTGQDRVIEICKSFNADHYINPIGGVELYENEAFTNYGISLLFLKTDDDLEYNQWGDLFIPNLSIIDVLMFNSKWEIAHLLEKYCLIN